MKKSIAAIILLLGLGAYLLSVSGSAPEPAAMETFAKAAREFDKGAFDQAKASYQSLLRAGVKSASVYYNLGLTEEALDDPGPAMLHYRKAAQLAPQSAGISAKIAELQLEIGSSVRTPDSPYAAVARLLPPDWWAVIAAMALLFLTVLAVTQLLRLNRWSRRTWIPLSTVSVLFIAASVLALVSWNRETQNRALVLTPGAPLRVSPFDSAESSASLPAGEPVRIVPGEQRGDYQLVKTADGGSGWVKSPDIATITDS